MSPKSLGPAVSSARVFVDADVIFAGAASPGTHSASQIILAMGELTLIEAITSQQAVTEVERALAAKLPAVLPEFRLLAGRALRVVPDPAPAALAEFRGQADPKDLPLLVAALQHGCSYLVTFNTRHYFPAGGAIKVLRPGDLVLTIRQTLGQM
jgi:predicted nucleic acid-binding protein